MTRHSRLLMLCVAVIAVSYCERSVHGNLLTNPGFESGSAGWTIFGSDGFGFVGGGVFTPQEGVGHLEIFSVGDPPSAFLGAFQDIPVVAG